MNTNAVGEVAEVVAKTGADPVLLGLFVVVVLAITGLVGWLMRNYEKRGQDVMEDYQKRMTDQASAHEASLEKLSSSFERSLDKVVATNETNVGKIVDRLDRMDTRLIHVEARLAPAPVIVNTIQNQEEPK